MRCLFRFESQQSKDGTDWNLRGKRFPSAVVFGLVMLPMLRVWLFVGWLVCWLMSWLVDVTSVHPQLTKRITYQKMMACDPIICCFAGSSNIACKRIARSR